MHVPLSNFMLDCCRPATLRADARTGIVAILAPCKAPVETFGMVSHRGGDSA